MRGHFGTLDKGINKEMVDGFIAAAKDAGVGDMLDIHWYEANHAFANPTGNNYNSTDAKLSLERTLAFFKANLAG